MPADDRNRTRPAARATDVRLAELGARLDRLEELAVGAIALVSATLLGLGLVLQYAVEPAVDDESDDRHYRLLTVGPRALFGDGGWGSEGFLAVSLTLLLVVALAAIASAACIGLRIGTERLAGTLGQAIAVLLFIGTLLAALVAFSGVGTSDSIDIGGALFYLAAGTVGFGFLMSHEPVRALWTDRR